MSRSNNHRGEPGHVPPPPPVPSQHGQPAHAQHAPQPSWPQQDAGQPPHAPQGYIPPPLPHHQSHQPHQVPAGYDQAQQGYYFPPQAAPQHDPYNQQFGQQGQVPSPGSLSSYVPAPQNAPWPAQSDPLTADPRGYDLGHYAAGQGYAAASEPPPAEFGQYGQAPAPHGRQGYYPAPPPAQHGYPHPPGAYDQPYAADPYGQSAQPHLRAPAGHPQHAGYDQPLAVPPGEHDHGEPEDFDEDYIEDEEPRRGRRSLMVVAALVGAIGIGGGLAYGYKKFAGPTAGKQIAAADTAKKAPAPISVAPAPDRKIAERLPDVVPAAAPPAPAAAPSDGQDLGGPRKVQLIPITPSGVPGTAVAAAPPPPVRPTINVPGVTLENTAPPPPVRIPAAAPPAPAAAVPAPVPQPPVRQAAAPVRPSPPPAAEAPPPAKTAKAPVAKAKTNDAYAPGGSTATASVAPAVRTGGNGYVAVLASQKSRMDALKVYADLQQKYGEVLSNKPADVQEANLGDKGVYYRAVVGPPGSREAATTLCTQLKTAGYTGCWVTAY